MAKRDNGRAWLGIVVVIILAAVFLHTPTTGGNTLSQWLVTPTVGSQAGQIHLFTTGYNPALSAAGGQSPTVLKVSGAQRLRGGPAPFVAAFSRYSSDTLSLNAWGVAWASRRELHLMQDLPIYAITVYVEVGPRQLSGLTSDGLVVVSVNGVEMNRTQVVAHAPVAVGTNGDTIKVYNDINNPITVKNITVEVFKPDGSKISDFPTSSDNRALDAMRIDISQRGGYADQLGATSTVSYPMVYDTGLSDAAGQKVWRTVTAKEFEGRALFGEEAYVITSPFSPKYVASGIFLNVTDILGPGLTIDQLMAYVNQTRAREPQTLHPTIEQVFDLSSEVITLCPVHSIYFPGFDGVTVTGRYVGPDGGAWAGQILFDQGTTISKSTVDGELSIGDKVMADGRSGVLAGACAVSRERPSQISPASILFLKLPGTTTLREIWSMFPAPVQPGGVTVALPTTPEATVTSTMTPPPITVTSTPPPTQKELGLWERIIAFIKGFLRI